MEGTAWDTGFRCNYNFKMDIKDTGYVVMDWISLA